MSRRKSPAAFQRFGSFEQLETRLLCAADWQNATNHLDVNSSGHIEALDALIIINDLNLRGARELSQTNAGPEVFYCDTNGDGKLTALDVMLVLNSLNSVDEGDVAPPVRLLNQAGEVVDIGSHLGEKAVVLYFYPKDDTPGCTVEALDFSNRKAEIEALGAEVYGVSLDPVDSHEQFADKHQLNFDILADTDQKVTTSYGVLTQLSSGLPIAKRTTFIIGVDGSIKKIFADVQVVTHGGDVVEALKSGIAL